MLYALEFIIELNTERDVSGVPRRPNVERTRNILLARKLIIKRNHYTIVM